MNHLNHNTFPSWLTEQIDLCARKRTELLADQRKDEANFEKIRENIYDVFRTVYRVAERTQPDPEKRNLFFLQKLEEIPSSWQTAYDKAAEHDDETRMHLEQLKLDTAARIRERYLQEDVK